VKVELVPFKSKSWGVVPLPGNPDHFHTGYELEWNHRDRWDLNRSIGEPKKNMLIGQNAIIDGEFRITGWSRGRSAANFQGHFRGHEGVSYELSMEGAAEVFRLLQDGTFPLDGGYMAGRFTFGKFGSSFFLRPLTG
jgi:hypothetical protein